MYKSMTTKLCVVKKYHTFIKLNAGYANIVCVGILHLLLVSLLAFEGKLKTGCEKALQLAFSNRQVVDLPLLQRRANKRSEFVSRLYIGGSSKGAARFMFISPLGEKK